MLRATPTEALSVTLEEHLRRANLPSLTEVQEVIVAAAGMEVDPVAAHLIELRDFIRHQVLHENILPSWFSTETRGISNGIQLEELVIALQRRIVLDHAPSQRAEQQIRDVLASAIIVDLWDEMDLCGNIASSSPSDCSRHNTLPLHHCLHWFRADEQTL